MNDDKREETGEDVITIRPADIELIGPSAAKGKPPPSKTTGKPGRFIWAGLLLLTGLALGVIFVLPRWVNPPTEVAAGDVPVTPAGAVPATAPAPVKTPPPEVSPWDQAQQARLRKTGQELLEQMLEAQDTLEHRGVKIWAADKYDHALSLANQGDDAYREQRFQEANENYARALAEFRNLLESMETVFSQAVQRGERALADGNSARAKEAFDLALVIKADDTAALRGQQRALTLDQLLALMAKGNEQHRNGLLEEARATFRQALDLDHYAGQAGQQLARVEEEIRDRDFNNLMSAGYASLEKGRLAEARQSFEQARKLKPAAGEAQSALDQTQLRITNVQINDRLAQAREAEKNENWAAAVSAYDQALNLDGSLVPAQEGKQHAALRAALDDQLQKTLSRPDRLTDQAVLQEAIALEARARAITDKGPRLSQQIQTLSGLLQLAVTPVAVMFQSDNQTRVTLYKVGELGNFENKLLNLLPGQYVAVGNRPGYRDVRVEFTVYTGKTIPPVVVRCEEKIALGK